MARGWSQETLGRKAGVTRGTISTLENGNSKGTTHLLSIAKALNVNPQWLESGKEPKLPTPEAGAAYISADSLDDLAEKLLDRGPDEAALLLALLLKKQAERK
ncbi:helix-turn-helix domain-containing protein [Chromobacterium vaccinii]|nr:helix-turn-helix domain-containing protein [Chromobacterium vaccinii]